MFHPLTAAHLGAIVSLILKQLGERLVGQERNITLGGVHPCGHQVHPVRVDARAARVRRATHQALGGEAHHHHHGQPHRAGAALPSHCSITIDCDPSGAALLFHVTTKQGKKDSIAVDVKKPAAAAAAAAAHSDAAKPSSSGAGAEAGPRKRNAQPTNELVIKDKKTTRARNLGIHDEDDMDSEEDAETMEL